MKTLIAMTIAGLLLGTVAFAGQDAAKTTPAKPAATKKARAKKDSAETVKYVDVTGSHIKRPVKNGARKTDNTLSVTVIDPDAPENRGLSNSMEMLARNPGVFVPPGGRN